MVVWQIEHSRFLETEAIGGVCVSPDGELLGPSPFIISNVGSPYGAAVASDGENYLVVWANRGIYGRRVNSTGAILDDVEIEISAGENRVLPALAFDGTNYLVVWSDGRDGTYQYDIYGARVSRDGEVLDSEGFVICSAEGAQENPVVAFDGANYMVVWVDGPSLTLHDVGDIHGARVSTAGEILDPGGLVIVSEENAQLYPDIAFGRDEYLLVWGDRWSWDGRWDHSEWTLYGARLDKTGTVLDPEAITISDENSWQWAPDVEFDGSDFLVVWSDFRDRPYRIYRTGVGRDGTVKNPSGVPLTVESNGQDHPAVALNGTDAMAVWHEKPGTYKRHDIHAARFSATDTTSSSEQILLTVSANSQGQARVASDGTGYMVVWTDSRDETGIFGRHVTLTGSVGDGELTAIAHGDSGGGNPDIASNGDGYLVVWKSSGVVDIAGRRYSSSGGALDESPIMISPGGNAASPAVASDGADYLVVWHYLDGIHCARVGSNGVLLDLDPIELTADAGPEAYPAAASNGADYLVVWRYREEITNYIYGARIDPDGQIHEPGTIEIARSGKSLEYPAVASDGEDYMVLWLDWGQVWSARVSGDGVVLDPGGLYIRAAAGGAARPSLAFDGANYVATWKESPWPPVTPPGARFARISPDGEVLDHEGVRIAGMKTPGWTVDAAWSGPDKMLLVYSSYEGSGARNSSRIWGNMPAQPVDAHGVQVRLAPSFFESGTRISYYLPEGATVFLDVFDAAGRLMKPLKRGPHDPGWHDWEWDGTDDAGSAAPSGVYFVRVGSDHGSASAKCVLVR
jgi:hypothetical protein